MEQGRKLRALYRSLGYSRAGCAKFLHISERCLRNWETGRHRVPYATLRLLRITCYMELPGKDWQGWHLGAGKLWTPEGHGLDPHDAQWWSLLSRRADCGVKALRELARLKEQTGNAPAAAAVHPATRGPACGDTGPDAPQGAQTSANTCSNSRPAGRMSVTPVISVTSDTTALPAFTDKFQAYQSLGYNFGGQNGV
jgi:DNA-binding XRE family transcriptional regulator